MGWLRIAHARWKIIVALGFCLPSWASMAQRQCDDLRRQLDQMPPTSEATQRLLDQLSQQQNRYDDLYREADQRGCMVLLMVFAPEGCRAIRNELDRTGDNVTQLQRTIRATDPNAMTRGNIRAALESNNCPEPARNEFRTVCARPADGYYFPLGYRVSESALASHEVVCRAHCDAAQLYFYRGEGESIEDAIDLEGNRYVDLPNAFVFRETFDASNACRPNEPLLNIVQAALGVEEPGSGVSSPGDEALAFVAPPVPAPRPDPFEDPETLFNRAGGFVPGAFDAPNFPQVGDITTVDGIRLVGPAYYYVR